jgi:hypothetical protein
VLRDALDSVLELPDEARVLDVGGWAAPLNRADWVIDLMPYATRGAMFPSGVGPQPERFSQERWVEMDICSHTPWPWEDDFFDFVVCTFTLEDIRDPVRVCEEMSRVGKAGYVEVPSLLDELTWRNPEVSGGQWVGHAHHRWLCTLDGGELVFLSKFHSLHTRRAVRVPPNLARQLTERERVLAHHWTSALPARERAAIDAYPFDELERVVAERFGDAATGWRQRAVEARDRVRRAVR